MERHDLPASESAFIITRMQGTITTKSSANAFQCRGIAAHVRCVPLRLKASNLFLVAVFRSYPGAA